MSTTRDVARQDLIDRLLRLPESPWRVRERERQSIRKAVRYVSWARRRQLRPPPPDSEVDRAVAALLRLLENDEQMILLDLIASWIPTLAERHSGKLEAALSPQQWEVVCRQAPREGLALFLSAREGHWPLCVRLIEGALRASDGEESSASVRAAVSSVALQFPRRANPQRDWIDARTLVSALPDALRTSAGFTAVVRRRWCTWLRSWFQYVGLDLKHELRAFGEIATLSVDDSAVDVVMEPMDAEWLDRISSWNPSLVASFASLRPERVASLIVSQWTWQGTDDKLWRPYGEPSQSAWIERVVGASGSPVIERLLVELGFAIGTYAAERDVAENWAPLDDGSFGYLAETGLSALPPRLAQQSRLWRTVRQLADYRSSYRHTTEMLGAETRLLEFASRAPDEWAAALPWLLARAHLLRGAVESISVLVAEHPSVTAVLESLVSSGESSTVRDRATGVLAMNSGLSSATEHLKWQIMTFAARQLDGSPAFPHPLEPMSSTWLGSLSVEAELRRAVTTAEHEFREFFGSHAGIEEEACTRNLLDNVHRSLTSLKGRTRALSRTAGNAPLLTIGHRQVPKSEEASWGCDIAFVVKVALPSVIQAEIAEFVQVKKPEAPRKSGLEAWRITTKQLDDVLRLSDSSVYWLLGRFGEVLVVPAKLLRALRVGRKHTTVGSFIAPYHEVRSAAIPLSQFLTDLLVGMWLGSTKEDALKAAGGADNRTVPRFIVTISINLQGEGQG